MTLSEIALTALIVFISISIVAITIPLTLSLWKAFLKGGETRNKVPPPRPFLVWRRFSVFATVEKET